MLQFSLVFMLQERGPRQKTRLITDIITFGVGNSTILNQDGKMKILSHVACFYSKCLAKIVFWRAASWLSRAATFGGSRIMCQSWGGFHLWELTGRSIPVQWRIQGRGPRGPAPQKSQKNFFWQRRPPPLYVRVWVTGPPPLIWRSGSTTAVIMRTSLLIKTIQPDKSDPK